MKNSSLIIICILGLLFSFCSNRVEQPKDLPTNTFSKDSLSNDSINLVDSDGKRHGFWSLYDGKTFVVPNVRLNEIEVGNYVHGKKDGVWQVLTPDGKLKHNIIYKDGEIRLENPDNK